MADKEEDKNVDISPDAEALESESVAGEDDAHDDSWQDELPPDDDFHDQEEPLEEVVEDDEGAEEVVATESEAEKKKRGKNVLLGAMAVGALFVGGLAYLQFSSGTEGGGAVPMASIINPQEIRKSLMALPSSETSGQEAQKNPTDIERLRDAAENQSEKAQTVAIPGKEGADLVTDKPMGIIGSDIVTSSSAVPVPTSLPPLAPATAPTKAPAPIPAAAPPAATAPAVPAQVAKIEDLPVPQLSSSDLMAKKTVDTTAQKAQEERLAEMNKKIEALQKSLDEANQKNTELLAKIESAAKTPVQTAAPSRSEAALQEKISQLESKLAAAQSVKAEAPKVAVATESTAEEVVAKPVKPKPVAKKKPVATKVSKKTEAKPAETQQPLVLRAATPEAAWVSAGRQTSELKKVSIGDELPGIGKIKKIYQNGERWEIVGDNGVLQ